MVAFVGCEKYNTKTNTKEATEPQQEVKSKEEVKQKNRLDAERIVCYEQHKKRVCFLFKKLISLIRYLSFSNLSIYNVSIMMNPLFTQLRIKK